ncbi:MAG: Ig-like domain-containing protein [Bacteroidales bacterium]|nr:Ig-like domain-containing protein [Bacteroidales bacterium]
MKKLLLLVAAAALLFVTCTPEAKVDKGDKPGDDTEAPQDIAIRSITLSQETLELVEGETATLTATVYPENATNKTVRWISDNTDVASVDKNGLVTANHAGQATIVAAAGLQKAFCYVSVIASETPVVPVESVSIDQKTLDLVAGDTFQLTATVSPDDATNKTIVWSSDDTGVACVGKEGLVTAMGAGHTTINAYAGSFSATCEVTVYSERPELTGISLNYSYLTVPQDTVLTLELTPIPSIAQLPEDPSWSNSNIDVVWMDEFDAKTVILAVIGTGKATIEATVGTFTARCTVTVVTTKSLPFMEDFEDESALGEWTFIDADGDGYGWWYNKYSNYSAPTHSGEGIICSSSYYNDPGIALTPDNWLFTPPVKLSSESNYLSFWVAPQDPSYPAEKYAVYISTEASANEESCTELHTEVLKALESRDDYLNHVIQLPEEFNGKVAYIAFRHFDCTDNFQIKLDDVSITEDKPAASTPRRARNSGSSTAARKK